MFIYVSFALESVSRDLSRMTSSNGLKNNVGGREHVSYFRIVILRSRCFTSRFIRDWGFTAAFIAAFILMDFLDV